MKLPNFFCLGAPKSGTTTLYDILIQHQEVFLPSFKEPHFFDSDESWNKGVDWYQKTYFAKAKHSIIGDFTPTYLSHPFVPERIKKIIGDDVKFVIILRNPTDRAYSHYLHSCRDQHEQLPFLEALKEEKQRLVDYQQHNNELAIMRFSYADQGRYATHLKRFFTFFDRKQFYITTFDDFVSDQEKITEQICDFLGLNKQDGMNYNLQSNQSSTARFVFLKKVLKKPSLLKKVAKYIIPSFSYRQRIRNRIQALNNQAIKKKPLTKTERIYCYTKFFKQEVEELEDLLSINLSHWKYD
jgi:hypothetical protein